LGGSFGVEFYEGEATGSAGIPISGDGDFGYIAIGLEETGEIVFGYFERDVTDVQLVGHDFIPPERF
jgi:hypothetical protein